MLCPDVGVSGRECIEKAEQKLRQSSEYVVYVSEGSKKILDGTGLRGGETLEERTKNVKVIAIPLFAAVCARTHSLHTNLSIAADRNKTDAAHFTCVCVYYCSTYYKAVHVRRGGEWGTCATRDDEPRPHLLSLESRVMHITRVVYC